MKHIRKLWAILLVLALLTGSMPLSAGAQSVEDHEVKLSSSAQYSQQLLSTPEDGYCATVEEAGAELRAAMVNRQPQISIRYRYAHEILDESGQIIMDLMDQIYFEAIRHTGNPKEGDYLYQCLYSVLPDATFSYTDGTYFIDMVYSATYLTTAQQEAEVDARVAEIVTALNLREDIYNYLKILDIYNYVCYNTRYDHENLEDESYLLKHSAYAALINGTAVCQGYAALFYRLALEAGVDCRVITGDAVNSDGVTEPHAWNIVAIDGAYYNADSTWDSASVGYGLPYEYFLKCPSNFLNHTRAPEYTDAAFANLYPMASEDYVYSGQGSQQESNFSYNVIAGNAVITGYTGSDAHVVIPETLGGYPVTELGSEVFCDNMTIESVRFPSSLVRTADGWYQAIPQRVFGTFVNCINLKTVVIPEDSALKTLGDYTFADCESLESIVLPDSLEEVNVSVFEGCKSLTELILPDNLQRLGQNFISDTGIKTLHVPSNTVLSFYFSQNLESFTVDEDHPMYREHDGVLYSNFPVAGNYEGWTLMFYPQSKPDAEYRVPDFCTHVWGEAFMRELQSKHLKTLYIGNANDACAAVDEYSLSRTPIQVIPDDSNPYLTRYQEMLFSKDMKRLIQVPRGRPGTIVIPDGVEQIEQYVLEEGQYNTVILPESVRSIGGAAFWQTPTLERIYIPGGLTEFTGSSVFQDCYFLSDVYFGGTEAQWEALFNPPDVIWTPSYLAPDFHLHTGSTAQVIPATCASPGSVTVTCGECSSSFTEILPAQSHNFSSSFVFDVATQTHSKVCLVCGEKVTAPCSMDEGTVVVAATPKRSGVKEFTCSVCNGSYQQSYSYGLTPMFRLYNPNSGEHFYTGSMVERDMLRNAGWRYEGIAWNAPTDTGTPVHRLYNPNSGDHHYTTSQDEVDMLVGAGWRYEGISWNSASPDNIPQYRLYNPNADCGSHHYTSSTEERDFLVSLGWIFEGIGWFGMK